MGSIAKGKVVYTLNNPDFTDLELKGQYDFYVYMMSFNVMKNREFAGKMKDVKDFKKMASMEMIRDQPMLIRMLTFSAFFFIVCLLIIWLVLAILGMNDDDFKAKRSLMLDLVMALVLLYLCSFFITRLQDKAQTKIEDINDNI